MVSWRRVRVKVVGGDGEESGGGRWGGWEWRRCWTGPLQGVHPTPGPRPTCIIVAQHNLGVTGGRCVEDHHRAASGGAGRGEGRRLPLWLGVSPSGHAPCCPPAERPRRGGAEAGGERRGLGQPRTYSMYVSIGRDGHALRDATSSKAAQREPEDWLSKPDELFRLLTYWALIPRTGAVNTFSNKPPCEGAYTYLDMSVASIGK